MSKNRCSWAMHTEIEQHYHDEEWGVPVYDDHALFEFLILEGAQAGLSWITILKKRDHYRKAFDNFDYRKIADYNQQKIDELLENPGIIRNKLKVRAAVTNAQAFMKVQGEFGSFSDYIWAFVHGQPIQNNWESSRTVPVETELSKEIAKDLKKRGFKFVGSTIMYAFMQAVGMVNDHTVNCFRHQEL